MLCSRFPIQGTAIKWMKPFKKRSIAAIYNGVAIKWTIFLMKLNGEIMAVFLIQNLDIYYTVANDLVTWFCI